MRRRLRAMMFFDLVRQHREIDIAVTAADAAAVDKAQMSFSIDDEICERCIAVDDDEVLLWWISVSYTHLTLPTTPYV